MNQEKITTYTLPNGLRCVHVASESPVGWCGLVVDAGSRDDAEGQYGLAHFVEHTIFKGTTHRRAWHIINRMEAVGGELNAYTTKEDTTLYATFPVEHFGRAIQLIADLVACSVFPEAELDRERGVVLEEIDSYRDSPADAVYDDFEDLLFEGSGIGHNILGNSTHLASITSRDCCDYLKRLYVPSNMVLFSMGSIAPSRVEAMAERHFGHLHHPLVRTPRQRPAQVPPQRRNEPADLHQSHTIIGARIPGMHNERRYALALLNNIMGGPGMNSLLNVQLRERRGYVYTVESSVTPFTDCGLFEVYFGCDSSNADKSLRIVERILRHLAETPLTPRQLAAAQKQYCGQLLLASDNAEANVIGAGKSLLYYGRVGTLPESIEHIRSLSAAQLMDVAGLLQPELCSVLTFG